MTKDAARRIQSQTAKNNGGKVDKHSFSARAMSAADKNANKENK